MICGFEQQIMVILSAASTHISDQGFSPNASSKAILTEIQGTICVRLIQWQLHHSGHSH